MPRKKLILFFSILILILLGKLIVAIDMKNKFIVANKNNDNEKIKYYIEKGVDINSTDTFNWTPLHYAVKHNNTEIAEFLLQRGANPKLKNKKMQQTPLEQAIYNNDENMTVLLKKYTKPLEQHN